MFQAFDAHNVVRAETFTKTRELYGPLVACRLLAKTMSNRQAYVQTYHLLENVTNCACI